MRRPVDLPEFLSGRKGDDKRSRLPIMIFGRRGTVAGNTRWTAEEWATRRPEHAGERAMHYIGGVIAFDEGAAEAERQMAFSTLMSWCTLAETAGMSVVCVPAWYDYKPGTQDLILLAAQHQLDTRTAADLISGNFTLKKRETQIRVVAIHGSGAETKFMPVSAGRRKPFDQNASIAWLAGASDAHPTTLFGVFETLLGPNQGHGRDFAAANDAAGRLLRDGWNRADIQRYLETFGYANSRGIIGRWPADRLAEVAGAVNP